MFEILRRIAQSMMTAALAGVLLVPAHSAAATFNLLYAFPTGGGQGANPWGGLVMDGQGNLYGTTYQGGGTGCNDAGCGTVFKLAPPYGPDSETILYAFTGGSDGAFPMSGVIMDQQGNLYGTTYQKGGSGCSGFGCGTIYKLAPPYGQANFSLLYSFSGNDGAHPTDSLIMDTQGNLFGTGHGGAYGEGAIFKLAPPYGPGNETVLYSVKNVTDSVSPGGLLMDNAGNLYFPSASGGSHGYGGVYKLSPPYGQDSETELYSFANIREGENPHGALIMDRQGNLFGTTAGGGPLGQGTVFKLAPPYGLGSETVLHSFLLPIVSFPGTPVDGLIPAAGVIMDAKGNLYGTTEAGGHDGLGTVFKLAPPYGQSSETQLHSFDRADGEQVSAGVIMDKAGNLYGIATYGGGTSCSNGLACGVVFQVKQ